MEEDPALIIDLNLSRKLQKKIYNSSEEIGSAVSQLTCKQPKVLVIDDNEAIIESLKYNLQKAGYKFVAHTKSLGALLAVMEERPDLILLEIKVPLLDGP